MRKTDETDAKGLAKVGLFMTVAIAVIIVVLGVIVYVSQI